MSKAESDQSPKNIRLNKRILETMLDALIFVEAGEFQEDEHGEITQDDYELALQWVRKKLEKYK